MTSDTPRSQRPGGALLELVAVMDRLRSPGGCPWDAEQTHESLSPYLIEETYEAVEAIDELRAGGGTARAHLIEELGDVLLQVVFHARVAEEHSTDPFDIDDVATGIVEKLRRRHPHVFGDVVAETPEQVSANWVAIKAAERAAAPSGMPRGPLGGIPAGLPALARATAVVDRLDAAGRGDLVDATSASADPGSALLAQVVALVRSGLDPEAELRRVLRNLTVLAQGSTD